MSDLDFSIVSDTLIAKICFALILSTTLLAEIYYNLLPGFQELAAWFSTRLTSLRKELQRFLSILEKFIKDYSSGHYYLPWGGRDIVMLEGSQVDHYIRELADNPQLSQRAVYADMFGFQYAMRHKTISLDPEEHTPQRYRLFSTVIRNIGCSQLTELTPFFHTVVSRACHLTIDSSPQDSNCWHDVKLGSFMRQCSTDLLGVYFYGESLYADREFYEAAQQFYHDVMGCMAVLQFAPRWLRAPVYKYMTNNGHSLNVMYAKLSRVISDAENWSEDERLKRLTMLHHFIENTKTSTYWTPDSLIQAITGIWFAACHQPWINLHFVMLELCQRPEYLIALREEIAGLTNLEFASISKMARLDSFIKECARLNPLDRVAIRRKALSHYQFRNQGPVIKKGFTVCIDAWGVMRQPSSYPNPDTFDGFRFVGDRHGSSTRGSTFTDANKEFPIWGYGTQVCPGRWHAEAVLKVALLHILNNYDFRLKNPDQRHMFWWDSRQMPLESTIVQFRKRDKAVLDPRVSA